MTLNIAAHRTILFQILKDIYGNLAIAPFLGFKGGTAALMFYGLDRFSVDLDFDLLDESKEELVFNEIGKIVSRYGQVKESFRKRFNLFWLVSYEDKARKIKIEINRTRFDSKYELKTYLGVSMLVMVPEDMLAHKLAAMSERIGRTSRDIYDVWFFLSRRFPVNKAIVEVRSGKPFAEFIRSCVKQLEKISSRQILSGLGELLTPGQKDWARAKLKEETIALLKLRG